MNRKLVRRSFLRRVAGGGALLVLGASAGASVHPPRRGLCSDRDAGAEADPQHAWFGDRDEGAQADPLRPSEGHGNDTDAGPNADPASVRSIGSCRAKPRAEPTRRARERASDSG